MHISRHSATARSDVLVIVQSVLNFTCNFRRSFVSEVISLNAMLPDIGVVHYGYLERNRSGGTYVTKRVDRSLGELVGGLWAEVL